MSTILIKSATSQSSSHPVGLTRLIIIIIIIIINIMIIIIIISVTIIIIIIIINKICSYNFQGNHIVLLDFCNWLAEGEAMGYH